MSASVDAGPDPAQARSRTWAGIACGIGAGALWGLVFLAPELVREFTPLQMTIGRYLCYGLIAAVLVAPRWRPLFAGIPRRQWWNLAWLALAGNIVYYLLLSSAVQSGGIAMASLVVGLVPVTVTVVGSLEQGAVPLRRLWLSLLLCVAGVACIGWHALAGSASGAAGRPLFGLACAIGALASWTAFAVGNARCLVRMAHVSAHDWNLLLGLVTGAQSLLLLPLALASGVGDHDADAWVRLGAVSLGVAVLGVYPGPVLDLATLAGTFIR